MVGYVDADWYEKIGHEVPCRGRISPSLDAKDWKKAQEDALKSVTDGVMDYISEVTARELSNSLEYSRKVNKEWKETMSKLRNKLEQMEKKKNKMTKAEAFEWLKCKKINANGYADSIQKKLFSLGVVWCTGDTNVAFASYLLINKLGELSHCGLDDIYFKRHCYEEVKAEDIISLEIEEECAKDGDGEYAANKISLLGSQICEILRQMNGHYHVEITEYNVNLYPEGTNLYHSDPF